MAEWSRNMGAHDASTTTAYNLKDPATFGPAAYLDVRQITIANTSQSNITVRALGISYLIPRGAPADLHFPGRVEDFTIATNAVAVADGELRFIFKGNPLPIHAPYLERRR